MSKNQNCRCKAWMGWLLLRFAREVNWGFSSRIYFIHFWAVMLERPWVPPTMMNFSTWRIRITTLISKVSEVRSSPDFVGRTMCTEREECPDYRVRREDAIFLYDRCSPCAPCWLGRISGSSHFWLHHAHFLPEKNKTISATFRSR